ncbi:DNA polymerase III subunit gamma/tau [Dehalococcoidia bacterium]|nr:DNA polymerase III subunit gamma/tau [Dehalococcoidia bacterium]
MSPVLYRKWRPQLLDDVMGQEPIVQTLRNAISRGKVAHAYLFCGPRGTGKTSTARILAKAVNCLSPMDGEPDNDCAMCKSINESRALDLIEIDAASNRGIDDIRNLKDKIHFAPNEASYKVYIIDEVHMLTEAAFNALLKTLEEPPVHAIFILATTEAHKVPLTIISRCQRFDFRRIPLETIVARLMQLCKNEGITATKEILTLLARTASGSLRDAENLLERAIVSYGTQLNENQLRDLLDIDSDDRALDLVENIVCKKVPEGLLVINEVLDQGGDLKQFHRSATSYLRGVMLAKAGAESAASYPQEALERLRTLARKTSLEHLLRSMKLLMSNDPHDNSLSPLSIEMAVVQSSLEPHLDEISPNSSNSPPVTETYARPFATRHGPIESQSTVTSLPQNDPVQKPQNVENTQSTSSSVKPKLETDDLPNDPTKRLDAQWPSILRSLSRHKGKRFNVGALLRSSTERTVNDKVIKLLYSHKSHMDRIQSELEDPQTRRVITDVLDTAMGKPYDLEVESLSEDNNLPGTKTSQRSHLVRALQGMGARVVGEEEMENKFEQKHVAPSAETTTANDESSRGA